MSPPTVPILRNPALWIALATLAAHLATATGYGLFRDEYYYLACADHLDWGYVDHPPLSIAVLAMWRAVFGDSAFALRLAPALLHALAVLGTGSLAQRMGAHRLGMGIAAACVGFAPGLLGLTSTYSMNAIELVLWVAVMLVAIRVLEHDRLGDWLLLGLLIGLGLSNKYSMALLGAGLFVGLLASERRGSLLTPRPWLAIASAALLFAPHLAWQVANGWPTREFIANAQQFKMTSMSPAQFVTQVWLEMLPPALLIWLPGLVALLVWIPLKRARALGVAFLCVALLLVVQKSKPYYLNAAFPILFAAGGVWWESAARARRGRWALGAILVIFAGSAVAIAPYAIPVLPVEDFIAYNRMLGIVPENSENHELGPLPQHFADRFGWPELTNTVAQVYADLDPREQASCAIVASNYGQAGALRYHGRALGLPPAVAQHNNFYLWGPGGTEFAVVIVVGQSREGLLAVFESVEERAVFDHPYAMPYERHGPIFVCRGWKIPPAEAWRLGRHYM